METEITDIGKVAITPRKDYKNEQTYEWLDVVTYNGASYMCISEDGCTGIVPTNTGYWQLLADKGHFTEEDKEEFKKAVVEESKTEINEHTGNKKTELNNYTTELEKSLENELDKYKTEKEAEMDLHKATLETEMANKKDSLIEEIETAQNGFDANVEEKTNTFNSNLEAKTTEFNNNSNAKTEEFNNNSTEKINNFNSNAEEKIADYNEHVETLTSRIADLEEENSELVEQMPWNTTEIQESIHVEDAVRYSKNKLNFLGNLKQEKRTGYNLFNLNTILLKYYITSTGIAETSGYSNSSDYIKVKANKTYLISFNYNTLSNAAKRRIATYTLDKTVLTVVEYELTKKCATITPAEDGYIRFSYDINCTDIQVIEGTEKKPYEQYGAMPSIEYPSTPVVATGVQRIKIVYNILPLDVDEWESGTIDGSTGNLVNNNARIRMKKYKEIEAKTTYIASLTNNVKVLAIRFYDKDYNYIKDKSDYDFLSKVISPVTAKYYKCILKNEKSTQISNTYIKEAKIILYNEKEVKENKLDLENTELVKILDANGNVVAQDRPVYREVNGTMKWQFEKQINKLVISGTTFNFNLDKKDDSGKLKFLYSGFNCYSSDFFVCDKLKVLTYRQFINPEEESSEYICGGGNYPRIYIKIDSNRLNGYTEELTNAEVVTLFKEFLNQNNITVYYIQGTSQRIVPTYEDCTGEQAEILDKLHKLKLQNGTNNIFVESENGVTTELQLEYMQDSNLIQKEEHKALEDRITAIEALLSTTETSALLLDNMQTDLESEVK